jgi:hypothetical protein
LKAREELRKRFVARKLAEANGSIPKSTVRAQQIGTKRRATRDDGESDDESEENVQPPPHDTEKEEVEDTRKQMEEEETTPMKDATALQSAANSLEATEYRCEACGIRCGTQANYASHSNSKKHRRALERVRGREILDSFKAKKLRVE